MDIRILWTERHKFQQWKNQLRFFQLPYYAFNCWGKRETFDRLMKVFSTRNIETKSHKAFDKYWLHVIKTTYELIPNTGLTISSVDPF